MITQLITGTLIGALIGLIPGMHINTFLPFISFSKGTNQSLLIISSSISFLFFSVFPSTLFGVPSSSEIYLLPTHKLVKKGKAIEAISTSLDSMLLSAVFTFPFIALIYLISISVKTLSQLTPFILVIVLLSFILKSRKSALITFLSSVLGMLTFHYNLLFPLLTGFFAVPNLIHSLNSPKPVFQKTSTPQFEKKIIRTSILASFLSSFFSLIPAVSSSIVSTIGEKFGKLDEHEFISFISASNFSYMAFSFYFVSLTQIARSGSSAVIKQVNANPLFYAGAVLFSTGISFFLSKKIAAQAVKTYQKANQRLLSSAALTLLIFINLLSQGFSFLVFLTSSSIGLLAIKLKVSRMTCMSSLITPTVFLLL